MYRIETDEDSVPIPDLGKTARRGQDLWVSPEEFKKSVVLQRLVRLGAVRLSQGSPSRMTKPKRPKSQIARLSRPRTGKDMKKKAPSPPPAEPSIPLSDVERMINQAVQKASQQTAEAILGRLPPQVPAQEIEDLEGRVERAVERALQALPTQAAPATRQAELPAPLPEDEPLFIPSNIVGDGNDQLKIDSESTEAGNLDDAAAALKALKKGKKKQDG